MYMQVWGNYLKNNQTQEQMTGVQNLMEHQPEFGEQAVVEFIFTVIFT